jgi:hypothetical protein
MNSPKNRRAAGASEPGEPTASRNDCDPAVRTYVDEALASIKFGEVRIVVQDGVVVQIDRIEKHRLR